MRTSTFIFVLSPLLLAGCAGGSSQEPPATPARESIRSASAELLPTRRSEVRGTIRFKLVEGGVLVKGAVSPLPHGLYGLGIHEGDCSAHDGKSATAYVGPVDASGRPLGRLEDIASGEDGLAKLSVVDDRLKLSGAGSIIGKALVVHAWPYDPSVELERVPYLACGVIHAE
jgi:superoxide dismutase, Cu-Zn family